MEQLIKAKKPIPNGPGNNYDLQETAKFNAQADQWWNPQGPLWTLHAINPLRTNFINDAIELSGKKALDVGCGGGILAESLAQRGAQVTAIDMAEHSISVAKKHAISQNTEIDYRVASAEQLQEQESFDLVCCMEVIEHVPSPEKLIADCAKLTKKGGLVALSTINRNPKAFLHAIVAAEYVLGMIKKGTHEYSKFVTPAEMAKYCRAHGLQPKKTAGMVYNPLTRKFSLNRNLSVNYLLIAEKQ